MLEWGDWAPASYHADLAAVAEMLPPVFGTPFSSEYKTHQFLFQAVGLELQQRFLADKILFKVERGTGGRLQRGAGLIEIASV